MNQAAQDQGRKPSPGPILSPQEIRQNFSAAWQVALAGGAPPDLETFVFSCPEPGRAALQSQLEQIDQRCRQALTGGPGLVKTVELVPEARNTDHAPLEQLATIESEFGGR